MADEERRQDFIWLGNQLFDRLERTQTALEVVLATTRGWITQGCPEESTAHVLAALDRAEALDGRERETSERR